MKNRYRTLLKLLLISLSLNLIGCSHLLYYPTKLKYINENLLEVKPKEVLLKASKQTTAYGWYFQNKAKKKGPIILFFHGNAQNISAHFQALYWILAYEVDFFIIDYPGYGKSPGDPTPKNTVEIGMTAIDWLKKNYPNRNIAVYAQSLGGPIAMKSLINKKTEFTACHLGIESSFASYRQVAAEAMKKSWITWLLHPLAYILLSDRHAPAKELAKLSSVPKLILHANEDPVVPAKLSRELFDNITDPKTLKIYPDKTHAASFHSIQKIEARQMYLDEIQKHCK